MNQPTAPSPPDAVHHLAVLTADLERAERFYLEVLGLALRQRHRFDDGRHRSTWVEIGGGAFLALELAEQGRPSPDDRAPGWHCVALRIRPDQRGAWRARLGASGHPVERETKFTLYTRDPDGCLVALSHHPVESAM